MGLEQKGVILTNKDVIRINEEERCISKWLGAPSINTDKKKNSHYVNKVPISSSSFKSKMVFRGKMVVNYTDKANRQE